VEQLDKFSFPITNKISPTNFERTHITLYGQLAVKSLQR